MKQINSLDDLTPVRKNPNRGTERGNRVLEDSLRKLGAGRSIVVDKNGEVIAGNKTLAKANELGLGIKVIDTDGNDLVVVRRKDLDLSDDKDGKARQLVYADNRVQELDYDLDEEILAEDILNRLDLSDMYSEKEITKILQQEEGRLNNNNSEPDEIMYRLIVEFTTDEERKKVMKDLVEQGYICIEEV